MSRVTELIVKVIGDASSFSETMLQVNNDLSQADRNLTSSTAGFARFGSRLQAVGTGLTAAISLPLAGVGFAAVRAAGDIEALKNGLTAVTGSAAATEKQFKELQEIAKLPGLGLPEAVRGATALQAVGFEANKSQQILRTFGNALASVGRGREDLEEVVRQLQQMASRGQVTADNLRPIIERVPQAAKVIREEFGSIDTEVLQKMGISSKRLIDVLLTGLGRLPPVVGGIKNDFENLRDSTQQALAAIGQSLAPVAAKFINEFATPALVKIQDLAKGFRELPGPVQTAALALAGVAGVGPIAIVGIGTILQNLAAIRLAMIGISSAVLGPAGLIVGLTSLAVVLGVQGYQAFQDMNRAFDEAEGKIKKGTEATKEWDKEAGKAFSAELPVRVNAAGTAFEGLGGAVRKNAEAWKAVKVHLDPVQEALHRLYAAEYDKGVHRLAEALFLVSKFGGVAAANVALLD